jgi:hypothetical protein
VDLLNPGGFKVFEDHLDEVHGDPFAVDLFGLAFGQGVDQFVVFIETQDAVGGEAFDRERARDADFFIVFVRFVVEVFGFGFGGDGVIDFFLPGDAGVPPLRVELFDVFGPFVVRFAGDFPFFPGAIKGGVELGAEGFECVLPLFPDDIDFSVVGNGFEGDMGDTFVDEAEADISVGGRVGNGFDCNLGFLELAVGGIGKGNS